MDDCRQRINRATEYTRGHRGYTYLAVSYNTTERSATAPRDYCFKMCTRQMIKSAGQTMQLFAFQRPGVKVRSRIRKNAAWANDGIDCPAKKEETERKENQAGNRY